VESVADCCAQPRCHFPSDWFTHGVDHSDKPGSLARKKMGKSALVGRRFITLCIFSVPTACILFMRQALLQRVKNHLSLTGVPLSCVPQLKQNRVAVFF